MDNFNNKYIFVTDAKVIESPYSYMELHQMTWSNPYVVLDHNKEPIDMTVLSKRIDVGRCYCNNRGQTVFLGIDDEVNDLLGLPFDEFGQMDSDLKYFRDKFYETEKLVNGVKSRRDYYRERLKTFNKLGFFKKLMFLLKNHNV